MSEVLERRLASVEKEQGIQGEKVDRIEEEIKEIKLDIKGIITLLSARPTWLIFFILTAMTTVTSSLIVYVVTSHH